MISDRRIVHIRITKAATVFLFLIIIALFATGRVNSQTSGEVGQIIDVGPQMPDMSFFSGDGVDLKVDSTDDVFAVGSEINVDETSADHLVVAGNEVTIRSAAIEDLIAAASKLDLISGTIEDDIVVAAGEVTVRRGMVIGGSAVIAGGLATIEAPIPVDLRVGAETVILNSEVGGDARLSGDTVTLGPNARIGGDLYYRTDDLIIQDGAVIVGERKMLPPEEQSAVEDWGKGAGKLLARLTIAVTLGFLVLVVIVSAVLPGLMHASAQFIRTSPFKSIGIGVLIMVGVPFAIALLFASVIGVPLALLLGTICLALTPVALAATACFIGFGARKLIAKKDAVPTGWGERLLWPALGAAVILALGMVPLLGLLVWLLALMFGLGAVATRGGRALAVAG